MTVSSLTNRVAFTGSGIVGPYSFPFRITAATDLDVTVGTGGIETTLVYPTDYTVTGVGDRNGGSISLTTALATGYTMVIRIVLPLLQSTELRNQGSQFPATIEDMADRSVRLDQQISETIGRTLTLPVTAGVGVSAVLPPPAANAAIFWRSDSLGLETRLIDTTGLAVPGAGRTVTTASAYIANNATFNVLDYGAVSNWNGSTGTDNTTAFNLCIAAIIANRGGVMTIPAGYYWLNSTVTMNVTAVLGNFYVLAYGAILVDGPLVSGPQFRVKGSAYPFGIVTIKGLGGHKTAAGTSTSLVQAQGTAKLSLDELALEDNKGGGSLIELTQTIPGNAGTNCFWTRITRCSVRPLSGPSPHTTYGVLLIGANNATSITECSFNNCDDGVALHEDGITVPGLSGAVVVSGNWFEGVTNCVSCVATPVTGYWPPGLIICNNRGEVTTYLLSMTTGGAAANNHSNPPFMYANYILAGAYMNNPTGAWFSSWDPTNFGPEPDTTFRAKGAIRFVTVNTAGTLLLANQSGVGGWNTAHIQIGENAAGTPWHLWVNNATGFVYGKFGSAPTSATDGEVITANTGNRPMPGIIITTAGGNIISGAGSLNFRNSANTVSNVTILDAGGHMKVLGQFACNGATYQASAALGVALAAYAGGANGLAVAGDMAALIAKVNAIDTALKANGIGV